MKVRRTYFLDEFIMNENGGNSDILSSIRVGLGHSERGFHSTGYCELVRKVTLIRMNHLRGAICGRCPALVTRLNRTPTPSKTPKRIPHIIAEPRAVRGPPMT